MFKFEMRKLVIRELDFLKRTYLKFKFSAHPKIYICLPSGPVNFTG